MVSRRSLVAGALGTTAAAVAVALPARSQSQFYPGTSVQGIAVGGMSRSDSEEMLRSAFTPLEDRAVTYTFEGQSWDARLSDLGMIVDYESMLKQAWTQGRDGNVIDRYATLLDQGDQHNVPLSVIQDDLKLSAFLENIGQQIHIDSENARLVQRGSGIEIIEDATGRALDLEAAKGETVAAVLTGRTSTIELKTTPIPPDVTAADLEGAREDAVTLVGEPVIFTFGDVAYDIDTEELTGALAIDADGKAALDLDKLQERLQQIADDVLTPAQNVTLGWDDGVYVIDDDVDGTGVDMDAIGPLLLETARTTSRSVPLPVQTLKAGARSDNIDELGLEGHLTYGSSSFAGSSETRAANVVAACNNVSYKLVGPGEQFSFNDQMGPISLDNGFVEGKIIQGDWTASDLGGGVCQVSTTVFRAALLSGFKFEEWYAHGWRLAFYETDGSPPGMDAAIYQPNNVDEFEKDLVFENPLDSWLLLMMVVDGDTAYAHLYGRDNGWTTEIFEPRVSEPKDPGEPVVRENPELARGERRKVQNAQPGYTVYLRRKVTDADGNVVSDGDFVSDYRAQPEAWEVGPGTPGTTATPPA
ncbi:MAG: VanW family protein [Chloroflexota bacterium]|nr:VanW family protein [Chloroflexota bacterium]